VNVRLRTLAFADLIGAYRSAFRHHWANRTLLRGNIYSTEEAEFLPAALALIERPISPTARVTACLLILLISFAVLWSCFAHVDIVVESAGKVFPGSRTKSIASVDVASVRAVYVVEGEKVKAGDVLVELDAGAYEADERKAGAEARAATIEMARSGALITAIDSNRAPVLNRIPDISPEQFAQAKAHLLGQFLDYQSKLTALDGEIDRYARTLPMAREREQRYAELSETHDVSLTAWSEKQQASADLVGQLTQARNARLSHIANTRRTALDVYTDAEKAFATATQEAARASSHSRQLTLRAPVDGSVQQLIVHTVGGVVSAAQSLMLIVPEDDSVEVEGYIENRDIGFVRENQAAEVKIDAFDYTKYGTIRGRVTGLSKDAVEDEKRGPLFKVTVNLDKKSIGVDGTQIALTPGMSVKVEIKTGTRRVIEYVLSPLLRHRHESLNER
jgi:hemolysin D